MLKPALHTGMPFTLRKTRTNGNLNSFLAGLILHAWATPLDLNFNLRESKVISGETI